MTVLNGIPPCSGAAPDCPHLRVRGRDSINRPVPSCRGWPPVCVNRFTKHHERTSLLANQWIDTDVVMESS
jgi:hypothetical protein